MKLSLPSQQLQLAASDMVPGKEDGDRPKVPCMPKQLINPANLLCIALKG